MLIMEMWKIWRPKEFITGTVHGISCIIQEEQLSLLSKMIIKKKSYCYSLDIYSAKCIMISAL